MPTVDPVTSPSSSSITLSQQALDSRLGQLGDKTVEAAQRLLATSLQSCSATPPMERPSSSTR
jgi:hypothetical protein